MDDELVEKVARSPKSELGLIAMAAWCNVTVDQLPEEARTNPNDYTRLAWERVFAAVLEHLSAVTPEIGLAVREAIMQEEG